MKISLYHFNFYTTFKFQLPLTQNSLSNYVSSKPHNQAILPLSNLTKINPIPVPKQPQSHYFQRISRNDPSLKNNQNTKKNQCKTPTIKPSYRLTPFTPYRQHKESTYPLTSFTEAKPILTLPIKNFKNRFISVLRPYYLYVYYIKTIVYTTRNNYYIYLTVKINKIKRITISSNP